MRKLALTGDGKASIKSPIVVHRSSKISEPGYSRSPDVDALHARAHSDRGCFTRISTSKCQDLLRVVGAQREVGSKFSVAVVARQRCDAISFAAWRVSSFLMQDFKRVNVFVQIHVTRYMKPSEYNCFARGTGFLPIQNSGTSLDRGECSLPPSGATQTRHATFNAAESPPRAGGCLSVGLDTKQCRITFRQRPRPRTLEHGARVPECTLLIPAYGSRLYWPMQANTHHHTDELMSIAPSKPLGQSDARIIICQYLVKLAAALIKEIRFLAPDARMIGCLTYCIRQISATY